jgi:hypothetical protein
MEFDPYYLTSYLHKNFLIPPTDVTYGKNFKIDFGLSDEEILQMLDYLEGILDMTFSKKNSPQRYEYVLDLIFYIIFHEMREELFLYK